MEAVPKLPMLYFELKISPVCPDFATPFKRVRLSLFCLSNQINWFINYCLFYSSF